MGNGSDWTLDANASAGVNVSESDAAGSAVESLVNVVVAVVLALLILATAIGDYFIFITILFFASSWRTSAVGRSTLPLTRP